MEGEFGKLPLVGKNWTVRGSYRARRAISEAHRRRPFDVLFVHTQTIGLFAGDYMARIPTLLSLDATPLNYDELASWYGDKVHHSAIERAKLLAHRAVMRRAKAFTVWSEWAKGSLVRDYGVNAHAITVLHPGTNLSNFPDPSSRGPRRNGPLRILFVGGDFPRKGGDLLLDTYRTHLAQTAELHLVTSEAAQVTPGGGVHVYTGVKPHSDTLLKLYADADVFVLPTRGDCLAVVLGEAMAASLPIVTTRVGAHAEAVVDGESGFLIDADDGVALRERLQLLASEPELCQRMGRRSREVGETHFDVYKNAARIADLLLELHRTATASKGR
jgi:glycosyltransferase involved in cell wall biosynthesis